MKNLRKPKLKCTFCGQEKDALIRAVVSTEDVSICRDCLEKKIQEAEQIVKKEDKRKLRDRAGRKVQLGTLTYSSVEKMPPFHLWDLLQEAAESYLEGCFRSCIFCCAAIAEQIIKHELIRNSKDSEERQRQLEGMMLGKLIGEAERLGELREHIADTQWLKDVRNVIAVHPLYVGVYEKGDDDWTRTWKNRTMIRNLRKHLDFLSERDRESILESALIPLGGGEPIKLRDMLEDPAKEGVFVMWDLLGKDMLEMLALEAYTRMRKIVEGVYPAD